MNTMSDDTDEIEVTGFDVDETLEKRDYTRDDLEQLVETGYQVLRGAYTDESAADDDSFVYADGLLSSSQSDGYVYLNKRKLASLADIMSRGANKIATLSSRVDSLEGHRDWAMNEIERYKNESLLDFIRRRYL